MGRTNPTYRDALRAIETRWEAYRRGLRRRDQRRFDRLFTYARDHADASGLLNHEDPLSPALFSVALEQERRLEVHERRLEDLEDALQALDDPAAAVEPLRDPAAAPEASDDPVGGSEVLDDRQDGSGSDDG